MKNYKLILIAVMVAFSAACKSKHNSDSGGGAGANGGGPATDVIVELHYYKGGWFGPSPNWSHDMKIDFLQYNAGKYKVTAKHTDPLCTKSGGVTVAEVTNMITIYSQLLLLTSTGITLPDLGNEYIEIKTQAGVTRKYHLLNGDVPAGEQYATNPQALHDFLTNLEASLAVACI